MGFANSSQPFLTVPRIRRGAREGKKYEGTGGKRLEKCDVGEKGKKPQQWLGKVLKR